MNLCTCGKPFHSREGLLAHLAENRGDEDHQVQKIDPIVHRSTGFISKTQRSKIKRSHLKKYSATQVHVKKNPKGSPRHFYDGPSQEAVMGYNRGKVAQDEKFLGTLGLKGHNIAGSEERQHVLAKMKALLNGVPVERHIVINNGRWYKLKLYFNDTHDQWYFIEIDLIAKIARKSIVYRSETRAKRSVSSETNPIIWLELVCLSSQE